MCASNYGKCFGYSQRCERSVLEVSLLCFTSLINTWKKRKGHSTYLHNFSWRPVIASCLGIQIHKLDAHLQIHSNRSCVIFLDLNYPHFIFANIVSHKKTSVWGRIKSVHKTWNNYNMYKITLTTLPQMLFNYLR